MPILSDAVASQLTLVTVSSLQATSARPLSKATLAMARCYQADYKSRFVFVRLPPRSVCGSFDLDIASITPIIRDIE
jgi:hypothetical protein